MNKCAEIREKAENFFLACDDDQKEGITEHLVECPDCLETVAKIYGQSKVVEEASHAITSPHHSEQDLAGLLCERPDDEYLNFVKEHVESCENCRKSLDHLREKAEKNAQAFCKEPCQYLK